MSYFAIPTSAGQAAVVNAVQGVAPLAIAAMVLGDGHGSPTTPVPTQATLVNKVAEVSITSILRDPNNPNQVNVDAILDENTGGFTIREIGLVDGSGTLLFVANVPDTEKQSIAQGVDDILTIGLVIVISSAASIVFQSAPNTYVTGGQLAQFTTDIGTPVRPPFIAVISASTTTPPTSPSIGDTYLVPASGASGAWAPYPNQLAEWSNAPINAVGHWVFRDYPLQSLIGVADVGDIYERVSGGWRSIFASLQEHLAGAATKLVTNPSGVAAMISGAIASALANYLTASQIAAEIAAALAGLPAPSAQTTDSQIAFRVNDIQ